jgi:hypothetical protein
MHSCISNQKLIVITIMFEEVIDVEAILER